MFAERNHLTDPAINLSCVYCGRDLYPFFSIDRFNIVLESVEDLKRAFIRIRCFSCKRIFHERKSRHKEWLYCYEKKIIEQFEKQNFFRPRGRISEIVESGSEKK